MSFKTVKMEVSKSNKATGKREALGTVDIFVPTLEDAGITAEQAVGEDKKPLFDDEGLPVYVKDEHNWLQAAMYTQVKAQARNRIVPQTLTIKDGAKIASNWAELTAENTSTGNAAALTAARELRKLFLDWVASLGKSPAAATMISSLFTSHAALKAQDATTKEKMQGYIMDFVGTLSADVATKYEKGLQTVLDICSTNTTAEDF